MNEITLDLNQSPDLNSFFTNRKAGDTVNLTGIRMQITDVSNGQASGIIESVTLPDTTDEDSVIEEEGADVIAPEVDDLATQALMG